MSAAMRAGTDPADPEVQRLAARWRELVRQFSGGDAVIEAAVAERYRREPALREATGLDPRLMEYVARALAAGG